MFSSSSRQNSLKREHVLQCHGHEAQSHVDFVPDAAVGAVHLVVQGQRAGVRDAVMDCGEAVLGGPGRAGRQALVEVAELEHRARQRAHRPGTQSRGFMHCNKQTGIQANASIVATDFLKFRRNFEPLPGIHDGVSRKRATESHSFINCTQDCSGLRLSTFVKIESFDVLHINWLSD